MTEHHFLNLEAALDFYLRPRFFTYEGVEVIDVLGSLKLWEVEP